MAAASGESIRVEFYGLARQRAATSSTSIAVGHPMTLASLWQELVERFPRLAEQSAADGKPVPQAVYRVNLDGQQFVTHPQTPIGAGQCVLVMSADVGG